MVREHEDMLVSLLPLPLEVLAELTDTGVDAVHSTPAWVAIELQLPPRRALVDVLSVKLTQVEREPVEDEEEMGARSCAKAGNVLVVRDKIAAFGHAEGIRANSAIGASSWCCITRLDLILPMMASSVPGVANPHHCDEAGLAWLLSRLESISFCLECIICCNDLRFRSITYNCDVSESKGRLQEVLCVEAVLLGVLPWEILAIVVDALVDEEQGHLVRSNVMMVEEVHWLDRVGCGHFEAGVATLHLIQHLRESDSEGLAIQTAEQGSDQVRNHGSLSIHTKGWPASEKQQNVFSDDFRGNRVTSGSLSGSFCGLDFLFNSAVKFIVSFG